MLVEFFQILPKNINGLAEKNLRFLIPLSNLLLYHCRLQIRPSVLFCPRLIVCQPLDGGQHMAVIKGLVRKIWPGDGFYIGDSLTHCP